MKNKILRAFGLFTLMVRYVAGKSCLLQLAAVQRAKSKTVIYCTAD